MARNSSPADQSPRRGPRPTEWLLSAAIVVLQFLAPRTGDPTPESLPAWVGLLVLVMAIGQGAAVVVVRRNAPAAAALVLLCYAGQSLAVGVVPSFAAWTVIWFVGSRRASFVSTMRLLIVVAAGTCAVIVAAELIHSGSGASALLVFITVVITLTTVVMRSERARIEAVRRQGGAEERLRIARDLHDLVGHGLSVVAIQSSTGRMALDAGDPASARAAMSAVEASSRTAMAELRIMLGVLADDASDSPAPVISDIPMLVDNVRSGDVDVDLQITGSFDVVPGTTQLAAYRVVQEGLTNALRHAPGSRIQVGVRLDGDRLSVTVESSGGSRVKPLGTAGGSGLEGLRARVTTLSGNFQSVPTADGWLLEAELPVTDSDARPMPLPKGSS